MGVDTAERAEGAGGKGGKQARLEQLYGAGLANAFLFLSQGCGICDPEFVFEGHGYSFPGYFT